MLYYTIYDTTVLISLLLDRTHLFYRPPNRGIRKGGPAKQLLTTFQLFERDFEVIIWLDPLFSDPPSGDGR